MKRLEIRQCLAVRDAMIALLRSGLRLHRKDLVQHLRSVDRYLERNFSEQRLSCLVGHVLALYPEDFYGDPSDRRISLTRSRKLLEVERLTVKSHHHPDTTAAGRSHDALQAAEG